MLLRVLPLLIALLLLGAPSRVNAALVSPKPSTPSPPENASTAFFEGGSESRIGLLCHNDPVNKTDPTGEYAGLDDAAFSLGGAVVGLVGQGIGDLISGHLSGWQNYAGSAIGGAAGGEALLYTGPVGAGLIGGATANLATQGLNNLSGNQSGLDAKSLAVDSAVGAATGLVPGLKIPGISAGRGSYNQVSKQIATKLANGTISSVRPQTAAKMAAAQAAQNLPGAGAGAAAALLPKPETTPPKSR